MTFSGGLPHGNEEAGTIWMTGHRVGETKRGETVEAGIHEDLGEKIRLLEEYGRRKNASWEIESLISLRAREKLGWPGDRWTNPSADQLRELSKKYKL